MATAVFIALLALIIVFLAIAYQDLSKREVSLALFLCTLVLSIFIGLGSLRVRVLAEFMIFNVAFLLFNLLVLAVYLYMRFKAGPLQMFNRYLGVGDVFFWLAITPLLSPLNFVWFYLLSLLLSAIAFALLRRWIPGDRTVPLAGLQSIFFALALLIISFEGIHSLYTDLITI